MSAALRPQPGDLDRRETPSWDASQRDAAGRLAVASPDGSGNARPDATWPPYGHPDERDPAESIRKALSIRASILAGFACMVVLTASIGAYSVWSTGRSSKLVKQIYDRSLVSINYVYAARADFFAMRADYARARVVRDPDRLAAVRLRTGTDAAAFFDDLDVSVERAQTEEARRKAAEVKQAALGWIDVTTRIGSGVAAPDMLARLDGFSGSLEHELDLLVNIVAGDGFLARQHALRAIDTDEALAVAATLAALLASGLVTWWLTRRISGPVAAASAIAVRIADGDLNVAIPAGRADELGSLLASMATMRDSIRAMMAFEVSQRRSAQARLMDAIQSTQEGVVLVDSRGQIVVTNAPVETFFGAVEARMAPSLSISDLLRGLARNRMDEATQARVGALTWTLDDAIPGAMELGMADGRWLRVGWSRTREDGLVAFFSDVTTARMREELLARTNLWLDAALTNMSQGLAVFDSDGLLKIHNHRLADIYRLERDALVPGMTATQLRAIMAAHERAEESSGTVRDQPRTLGAMIAQRAVSERMRFLTDGRVIATAHRPVSDGGWVMTCEDVTERHRGEMRISFLARHDGLTNLPNRFLFTERLDEALAAMRQGVGFGLLLIDLDRFKEINDTRGHPVGDGLLRAVADRLLGCSRRQDTVARLGGDEFAIIQTGTDDPQDARELARRVVATISEPFAIDGAVLEVGASVGIVSSPAHGSDAETLLRSADIAMYRAKEEGRNDFRLFAPSMDAARRERRALAGDLQQSLADGQMEVFYQPIVGLPGGGIIGFEALLRWHHPARGLLMPGDFIGVAEDTGFIEKLGGWILMQACADALLWPAALKLAINVSPIQFRSGRVVRRLTDAIDASGIAASRIDLEITETALLHENEATLGMLRAMHEIGVKIVLDDFGTGFSSLSYLRSFPFDRIKIDRSFVKELGLREESSAIIRAIVALGGSLGMPITAEGVETAAQRDRLAEEGCDEAQGFLFSRPVRASAIEALLDSWTDARTTGAGSPE